MTEIQAAYAATAAKTDGGPVSASQAAPDRRPESNARPRRLGMRAALNRARTLRNGRDLSPEKEAILLGTGRLMVHRDNISNKLFVDGELRADGELRVMVPKLMELDRQIGENLRYVFSADGDKGQW